jgi:hypothetical protein
MVQAAFLRSVWWMVAVLSREAMRTVAVAMP